MQLKAVHTEAVFAKGGDIFQVGSVYGAKTPTSIGGGGVDQKTSPNSGKNRFWEIFKRFDTK